MMGRRVLFWVILAVGLALAATKQFSIESIAEYDPKTAVFTVSASHEVGVDEILLIPAGVTVQFLPLTGITVKGELVVDGKPNNQVTLTSKRGQMEMGAAYDWQGITVFPGAKLNIRYALIAYASVAVKTCCDNVTMTNVVFFDNGTNFQVGDRRIFVKDRVPTNYEITLSDGLNLTSPVQGVDYSKIAQKNYVPGRFYVLMPIAMGLAAVGGAFCFRWVDDVKNYNRFGPDDARFGTGREHFFKETRNKIAWDAGLGIGLSAAGLGLGGYTMYYTWKF